jgi:hypothetical protein
VSSWQEKIIFAFLKKDKDLKINGGRLRFPEEKPFEHFDPKDNNQGNPEYV